MRILSSPSLSSNRSQDRKYFDSGDYALSKAGKAPQTAVGTAIPNPEKCVPRVLPHVPSNDHSLFSIQPICCPLTRYRSVPLSSVSSAFLMRPLSLVILVSPLLLAAPLLHVKTRLRAPSARAPSLTLRLPIPNRNRHLHPPLTLRPRSERVHP